MNRREVINTFVEEAANEEANTLPDPSGKPGEDSPPDTGSSTSMISMTFGESSGTSSEDQRSPDKGGEASGVRERLERLEKEWKSALRGIARALPMAKQIISKHGTSSRKRKQSGSTDYYSGSDTEESSTAVIRIRRRKTLHRGTFAVESLINTSGRDDSLGKATEKVAPPGIVLGGAHVAGTASGPTASATIRHQRRVSLRKLAALVSGRVGLMATGYGRPVSFCKMSFRAGSTTLGRNGTAKVGPNVERSMKEAHKASETVWPSAQSITPTPPLTSVPLLLTSRSLGTGTSAVYPVDEVALHMAPGAVTAGTSSVCDETALNAGTRTKAGGRSSLIPADAAALPVRLRSAAAGTSSPSPADRAESPTSKDQATGVLSSRSRYRGRGRPPVSNFTQQKMFGRRPNETLSATAPLFLISGTFLLPLGIVFFYINLQCGEVAVDYTHCKQFFWENGSAGQLSCADVLTQKSHEDCSCIVDFNVPGIAGKVLLYYELSHVHQNVRRYVLSRDDKQLQGRLSRNVSRFCAPFDYDSDGRPIAPCGAVADTMFNDSLRLSLVLEDGGLREVPLRRTGIAWPSDKARLFANPPGHSLQEAFRGYAKPRNWRRHVYELDPENPDNNGFLNEDLIVWMRVSALSPFRKLYRRVDHSADSVFSEGLPAGTYRLLVDYSYPVVNRKGSKQLVVSRGTLLGGHNEYPSVVCLFLGVLCFALSTLMFLLNKHSLTRCRKARPVA